MSDNVISLRSRKPLAEEQAEEIENKEELNRLFIEGQLELLDKVRAQIEAGNLSNLIIVSRNPQSGMFMHDLIFEPDFHTNGLAFAFAGLLEALKLEITDVAQLTPTLMADGKVVDPHFEDEIPEEGDW